MPRPCINTLVVVGQGREAMDAYAKDGVFFGGDIGYYKEEHRKRMCEFFTDSPPIERVKKLIAQYPHLRFVLYFVCDRPYLRGMVKGTGGFVTHERQTDEPEKFPLRKK